MPNIKSAAKRVEMSKKYAAQNRFNRSAVKTIIKKFDAAVEAGAPEAADLLRQASSIIDKAASKGAFHKKAASHKKAQLAKKLVKKA